jgi:hypothetical protein
MPVPVHILGGFLGTGKTTTIRAQLAARPGARVAVIVNDFGEAGLDAARGLAPYRSPASPAAACCTAPEGLWTRSPCWRAGPALDRAHRPARPQDLVDTIRRRRTDVFELAPSWCWWTRAAREGRERAREPIAQQSARRCCREPHRPVRRAALPRDGRGLPDRWVHRTTQFRRCRGGA